MVIPMNMNQTMNDWFHSEREIYARIEEEFAIMADAWGEVDRLFKNKATPFWSNHVAHLCGGILDDLTRLAFYGPDRNGFVTFKGMKKPEKAEHKWEHWKYFHAEISEHLHYYRVHRLYKLRNDYAHCCKAIPEAKIPTKSQLKVLKSFLSEIRLVFEQRFARGDE
jgi:hypothetical protein